jgi:hypothetical protein
LHRGLAEVAGESLARFETDAVVADLKHEGVTVFDPCQAQPGCPRVLHSVVQRLASDPVELLFHLQRQVGLVAEIGLDLEVVAIAQRSRLPGQHHDEPLGCQEFGPQLKDQRSHLSQPSLRQRHDLIEDLGDLPRIALQQDARGSSTERHAVEHLRD